MKSPIKSSRFLAGVAVIGLTLACYWPVTGFEFSTWDDGLHVTENPRFNPPRLSEIGFFWTHPFQKLYIPLSYSLWMFVAIAAQTRHADITGTALNPYVFHLANLLLHAISALVVYEILRRLFHRDWPAAIGTLLFALHPLQVEPVAWVSGFRDLLCGLFSLATIHQYIAAFDACNRAPENRSLHVALTLLAYCAAMLCKPTAACLPLVLAAIDYLMLRRPARRVALAVVPLLVATFPIILISRRVQPTELLSVASPLWARPFIAGDALMFYLWKLFIPFGLAMDYGRRPQVVLAHLWIYASWMIPAAIGIVILILSGRGAQYLLAGAAIMLAALLPVLGLIPFNFQAFSTVADRYMYIAMLGPAVALTGFLSKRGLAACGLATALVLMLGIIAHRQVWFWRDDTVLYPHTIAINADSFTANNNLAAVLLERGRPAEAIEPSHRAVQISPGFALAWINLADALSAIGRESDAINAYRTALTIQPNHAAARTKLALGLASVGDADQARVEYERAVRDDPNQRTVESQLEAKIRARR